MTEEGELDDVGTSDVYFMLWDVLPGRTMSWDAKLFGYPTIAKPQTAKFRKDLDPLGSAKPPGFDWGIFSSFAAGGLAPVVLLLGAAYLLGGGTRRR